METQRKDSKDIKVYVAVSGGVDSSVALALLHDEGYEVTGVYFKTYKPDGNREYCKQQGLDAQAVCEHLGVPFKVFDLQEEYRQKVFDYMIEGYQSGQTPNPDIMCNKEIKFGIFAQKAFADGADYIATGHYARIEKLSGEAALLQAVDASKDQSYFLSQVSQEVLGKVMFPLGELHKTAVRELAVQYGLHTSDKQDSQGICFIGQEINVKEFLNKYIPKAAGDVLDIHGEVIGTHAGARLLTVGERHGFTISPAHQTPEMDRLFVMRRDIEGNTVTVGTRSELDAVNNSKREVALLDTNWLQETPESDKEYMCRIRHRGELYRCTLTSKNQDGVSQDKTPVCFIDAPYAPAAGQFLAVYDAQRCLGGGVMVECSYL